MPDPWRVPASVLANHESEDDFMAAVTEFATYNGWTWTHFRSAQTRRGWRTPVQGWSGFPDLVLVRAPRIVFAELKAQRGRLSPEQKEWIALLRQCVPHVYVWRPKDWPEIVKLLER